MWKRISELNPHFIKKGVTEIGDLHIYQIEEMEEYLPKKVYYGNAGRIQSFLDSLSSSLFPDVGSKYFNEIQKRNMLKLCNVARNLALYDMRKNLVIRKMNWYVEKIIELVSDNKCDYDGYCVFLKALAYYPQNSNYRKVEIEVCDCADNRFLKMYEQDYQLYIREKNYLKRDYSDKLLAYTCNLLELYGQYFEKENDSIRLDIYMNGDKCFGGRGFIEWR